MSALRRIDREAGVMAMAEHDAAGSYSQSERLRARHYKEALEWAAQVIMDYSLQGETGRVLRVRD